MERRGASSFKLICGAELQEMVQCGETATGSPGAQRQGTFLCPPANKKGSCKALKAPLRHPSTPTSPLSATCGASALRRSWRAWRQCAPSPGAKARVDSDCEKGGERQ